MLAIRMQRTGRKKHAMYRVVVQESRVTPSSGKVIAYLGSYDPHTKAAILEKEKAGFYLEHGAQPSDRVVRLLQTEGVKLPTWVLAATKKEGKLKHPEKLRKNQEEQPVEAAAPEPVAEVAAETAEPEAAVEAEAPAAEETTEPEAPVEAAPAAETEPAAEAEPEKE
jgi:small subunit ribosomal protein S16